MSAIKLTCDRCQNSITLQVRQVHEAREKAHRVAGWSTHIGLHDRRSTDDLCRGCTQAAADMIIFDEAGSVPDEAWDGGSGNE